MVSHLRHLPEQRGIPCHQRSVELGAGVGGRPPIECCQYCGIWKILQAAESMFRRLKGGELLPAVYAGAQYVDGMQRSTSTQKIAV